MKLSLGQIRCNIRREVTEAMAYLFPLAGLFTAVLLSSFVWLTTAKCGGKTVLKALQGTIDDGPNNYPKNQQCEWLIEGKQRLCMNPA